MYAFAYTFRKQNIMSKHSGSRRIGSAARTNRTKKPVRFQTRRIGFEGLENRRLLASVGLSAISAVTLPAGTSVLVALNGSDPSGKTVNFGVTTSNPTEVTPLVMPQSNPSVQYNIAGLGSMTFQLFANLTPNTVQWIENLVNAKFYNGDYIYRAETGSFALIQGGNNPPQINGGADVNKWPTSFGTTTTIDEEFNPDLNYTTAGALAMARQSTANSSSSEFFITDGATRTLDYAYTLFGFMTVDQSITYNSQSTTVLAALDSMPTTASNGIDYLNTPVEITSASIVTDTQDGVLMLRAPTGVTGSFTVTVTAFDDGTNTPTTQTFTVNVVADTATGQTTNPWASKTPAAPTAIAFQPQSGQGTTSVTSANNSSTSSELQFLVSGVTVGDQVTLYADGVAIGSATATSSSVTVSNGVTSLLVSTNGTTTLSFGSHTFTATETLPSVTVTDSGDNSLNETANVDSLDSPGVQLQVSFAATSTPSTSALVGQAYTYTVQTNAPSGDTVTVTPGKMPTGMTYDAATETFAWTPASGQVNTAPAFSATVSDAQGHTASIGPVDISVSPPVTEIPVNATLGGNVTVLFTGSQVLIYDNIAKKALTNVAFTSANTIEVDCPAGQANSVLVLLPTSANAPLPQLVLVKGATGSTNNQVTVYGAAADNTFTLAGGTITGDGLQTQISTVQTLTLAGFGSTNNYFTLTSSSTPTWVVDKGGYNTMDFSHDTGAVTVNLGLDKGQPQAIAPWNTTLMIYGVINKLIGSPYADVLTGGPAATTEIVAGAGNATITGGSGDNILLGGGGNDTITGGLGKNLLIAGSGTCSLYAKGSEDLVFAGSTSDDSNDQALLNLLDQGSRVSYGYSVRRILASAAKNSALLSSPVVFQDSGAHDTIFGSEIGNWFVLGKNTTVES